MVKYLPIALKTPRTAVRLSQCQKS